MPTSKRNRLFQALAKYLNVDEASDLADFLQDRCPTAREAIVEPDCHGGVFVAVGDEIITTGLDATEAVIMANNLTEALA